MMKTYSKIAELQLKHTYYTSGLCPALSLKPTKDTVAIMAKYNFVVREINGSYALVGEDQDNLKTYLDYITRVTEMQAFIFDLTVVNPDFFIFTNIQKNKLGTYSYSTQNKAAEGILQPQILADKGVFATIKFCFADLVENTNAIYQIQFQASQSIWNYIVVNRSALEIENCFIKTSNSSQFNTANEMTLPTGEKATGFSSKSPINMRQTSKVSYDLVKASQNSNLPNGKMIFKGLPLSGPINTGVNNINSEEHYVSSLYIYI